MRYILMREIALEVGRAHLQDYMTPGRRMHYFLIEKNILCSLSVMGHMR